MYLINAEVSYQNRNEFKQYMHDEFIRHPYHIFYGRDYIDLFFKKSGIEL